MMKILTASERRQSQTGVKMAIFGQFGIGKTSLLKTLSEPTLCLDFEAGLLAVQDWDGDSISIRTWDEARDIACLIGGVNPASTSAYSKKHFDAAKSQYANFSALHYKCIFIDSISIASKLCLSWCKNQPNTFSPKTGQADIRAAYGLLATELSAWLSQFQHIPDKDIIFVGLLNKVTDEFNRSSFVPQIEGQKINTELPAILDEVVSMVFMKNNSGSLSRKLVCHTINAEKYPAKDRSGKLAEYEEPNLDALLTKIKSKNQEV